MNVRVPKRVTNKQKEAIRDEVAAELQRQGRDNSRRMCKLFCAALHKEFGFGKDRCMRVLDRIREVADEHEKDEEYWTHIDQLMEQLGIEFTKEDFSDKWWGRGK